MITPTEMRTYKTQLQALVERFTSDVTELQVETRQACACEGGNGLPMVPALSGDQDTITTEEDMDLVLLEHEKNLLAECHAALTRIEQGTFGRCEDCTRPIPKRRLKAFPYARCCLGCASLREREVVG